MFAQRCVNMTFCSQQTGEEASKRIFISLQSPHTSDISNSLNLQYTISDIISQFSFFFAFHGSRFSRFLIFAFAADILPDDSAANMQTNFFQ